VPGTACGSGSSDGRGATVTLRSASDAPKEVPSGDAPKEVPSGDAPKEVPLGDAPKVSIPVAGKVPLGVKDLLL
jgi:hypothetical protein